MYSWKLFAQQNLSLFEVYFFGLKLRADPVNSVLLNKAFTEYYKKADRSKKPFPFVVITHSSEATYYNGKPTKALKDLDGFISLAKSYENVEYYSHWQQ